MAKAGVPILPGTGRHRRRRSRCSRPPSASASRSSSRRRAGGGGRGMKIVDENEQAARRSWTMARAEALAGVRQPRDVYLERYVEAPRHIEVQVVADKHGHVAHLGERECSIQRRHQKLIEEAPSSRSPTSERAEAAGASRQGDRARSATRTSARSSSCSTSDGSFYFMEMNTRLQVEHPVTELVTGLDLVREQIRLAAGEPLSLDVTGRSGRAATRSSAASTPRTRSRSRRGRARSPRSTCRAASACASTRTSTTGYVVPPNYDSLLAKLIVHAEDRTAAIRRAAARARRVRRRGHRRPTSRSSADHRSPRLHREVGSTPDFVVRCCRARDSSLTPGRVLRVAGNARDSSSFP